MGFCRYVVFCTEARRHLVKASVSGFFLASGLLSPVITSWSLYAPVDSGNGHVKYFLTRVKLNTRHRTKVTTAEWFPRVNCSAHCGVICHVWLRFVINMCVTLNTMTHVRYLSADNSRPTKCECSLEPYTLGMYQMWFFTIRLEPDSTG